MKTSVVLTFACATVVLLAAAFSLRTDHSKENEQPIVRIWRGWTSHENAPALEKILTQEAIPAIEASKPKGLKGITVLTLAGTDEVQFTTIMYFESVADVKQFAGENYERAHIDPAVAPLLLRYDKTVEHHVQKEMKRWD